MKKAFTLLELLVVIGIIGILSGVLVVALSGSSDSANAAKCLANMHHLAVAAQSYGMSSGAWPSAGSFNKYSTDWLSTGSRNVVGHQGWIGWPTVEQGGSYISPYSTDREQRHFSITNGTLWKSVGESRETYVCPVHRNLFASGTNKGRVPEGPCWSYVMNGDFHWASRGDKPFTAAYGGVAYSSFQRADHILLFAELPFLKIAALGEQSSPDYSSSASEQNDPTLQYANPKGSWSGREMIGFNHKVGKREYCAHVVFADAHTERLKLPMASGSANSENLRELTKWLCRGRDDSDKMIAVGLNGSTYEAISR